MVEGAYKIPCRGCKERSERCHGSCERYKAWLVINEERKAEEKKMRERDSAILSPAYERIHRNAMRRKQQRRK